MVTIGGILMIPRMLASLIGFHHGQDGNGLLFIEVLPLTIMGFLVLVFLFRYTVHQRMHVMIDEEPSWESFHWYFIVRFVHSS